MKAEYRLDILRCDGPSFNPITACRQITTGEEGESEFVTDQGLVVPAVSLQLRERLQAVISNHGMGLERQAEVSHTYIFWWW